MIVTCKQFGREQFQGLQIQKSWCKQNADCQALNHDMHARQCCINTDQNTTVMSSMTQQCLMGSVEQKTSCTSTAEQQQAVKSVVQNSSDNGAASTDGRRHGQHQ